MKRMTPRTALAFATIAALGVGALAGCSTPEDDSGAVELEMWTFKQSHVEALEQVAAECFPDGDITVDVEAITPDDAFTTKVQAAVQTKDLPDLLAVHSADEDWRFAQAGILTDITDYFEENLAERFTEHTLGVMELTQAQIDARGDDPATTIKDLEVGTVYSVPLINGAANVVIANRSKLEAAGVDADEPPATWEEWVADMEQVKAADPAGGGLVAGYQITAVPYLWLYQPMAAGFMGIEDYQNRTAEQQSPAWNSPKSVRSLELWNMLTPVWADGVFNLGIDQADQAFASGKAGYVMGGTFTLPFLIQQGMELDDLLIFQAPLPEDSVVEDGTMTTNPLVSTGITTTTEHHDEALAYIDCLSSEEGAVTFMGIAGDLASPRVDIENIESPTLRALAGLFDREGATALNPPWPYQLEPTNGDTVGTASNLFGRMAAGEMTPQQVADELTRVYQEAWAAEQ